MASSVAHFPTPKTQRDHCQTVIGQIFEILRLGSRYIYMSGDGAASAPAATSPDEIPSLEFIIALGKNNETVVRPSSTTIGELRADIETRLSVPTGQLKLLCAGKALKDDSASLEQAGIRKGSKVLLLGTK